MLVATHRGCDSIPVASVCFTENNMRNRPKIQLQKSNCFPAKSVFPFPLCRTVKSLIKPGSPPLVVHREEVCVVGGCISNENPNLYPKRNFPDFLAPPKKGEFWEILFRPSPVASIQHMMCSKINDRRETVHGGCILSAHLLGTIDQFHRGAHRIPPQLTHYIARPNGFIGSNHRAWCPACRGRYATNQSKEPNFGQ